MMKRLLSTMLTLTALLTTLQASAAMYILGDYPFGSWVLSDAVQMTDNGDGTYSYTTGLSGMMYFVFADGIANDWDTFSNNYRYGPTTTGQGETVNVGEWVTTQKSPTEAYIFPAEGTEYTITFDKNNLRFKIERNGPAGSFQSGGIYYNVTGANTVEVTKGSTYGDDYSGDVTIPSSVTYGGVTYEVTAIGKNAFLSCDDLTSVSIPTTVTAIEESAFYYCTALTRIVIPESVMTIGDWNFYCNDQLTTVILPSTLISIGSCCFDSCPNLSKVTCKATTPPAIGSMGCFSNISNESILYVPENSVSAYQADDSWSSPFSSVEAMPEYDFTFNNLKFVITSNNTAKVVGHVVESPSGSYSIPLTATIEGVTYRITEVGERAFYYCTGITSFTLGSNIEVVGPFAFYGCTGITTLNLGNVKTIDDCAFGDCSGLTSVTIPSSVTSIGHYGFGGCGLTTVSIPATLEYISDMAFYNCRSLTAINVDSNNPNYMSNYGVLYNKAMTELHSYPAGKDATSCKVPTSVTVIKDGAFGASSLQSVTLPAGLNQVGYLAFSYNNSLTEIICLAQTPPSVGTYAFSGTIENSGLTLTVPRGRKSAYQAADGWRDFPTIVERYYDFYDGAFYYNITGENTIEMSCETEDGGSYSGTVTIPEAVYYNGKYYAVTAIGSRAFSNCPNLTAVHIPATVTEIGYMAFYCDYNLTSINLPEHLTKIGVYAFYYCMALGNVEIPASVTWLGTYAFCGCSSFTKVEVPSAVTTMGYGAFYGCTSLTKVTLGGRLNNIGADAFKDCTALETIIIHASTPPTISDNTFMTDHYSNVHLMVPKNSLSAYKAADYWKNFTNITSMAYDFEKDGVFYNILSGGTTVEVTYMTSDYNSYHGIVNIPETVNHNGVTYTVARIGSNAFYNCRSLTSVTMPNTVQTIGNYAFYHCDALTTVEIPNSVTTIGNAAFWLCLNLSQAIIPNSVTSISAMAFRNCTAMTRVVIGENVTYIGSTCFIYNPNITEVICLATTPPALNDPASGSMTTFQTSVYTDAVLRVPYGSHEAYRNDANWGKFVNIVSEEVVGSGLQGDVNGDGQVKISDVTALINYLLNGDASGINLAAADVNGDGNVKISDVTELINILLSGTGGSTTAGNAKSNFLINSVPFTMVKVDGGTFMMGSESVSDASPVHQVTLTDYGIGETEVTQALWQVVMGSNPSHFQSDVNLPVENMKWDDCQQFVTKLSRMTSQNFRLPTEAEWEFAARGGNKSQGYIYPGSNNLNAVAWYQANSGNTTHVVATKAPNELGLYDMSGNVFEWIQDYYGGYTSEAQVNPQGPASGSYRVCRSAGYSRANTGSFSDWFKCAGRTYDSPNTAADDTGLRLAMDQKEVFTVNGVSFTMIPVQGGTFMMGAPDYDPDAEDNEKPAHQVTLSSYSIGMTEVTQELWQAVMGNVYLEDYDGDGNADLDYPASCDWNHAQVFITKLNQLTGQHFRLPTEAEWEFAARGGNMSQGFKYAGSNDLNEVAVMEYDEDEGEYYVTFSPVAIKKPNELSIYDMSGNAIEHCQDYYERYSSEAQVNPTGPSIGNDRVIRGGRVTWRFDEDPRLMWLGLGFRLAR